MLEVDEDSNQEQGNENPIGQRDRPGKLEPDGKKKKGGHEFHHEVAEGNPAATASAASPEKKPAQERNVLMPLELGITRRAKGATRLVDREFERHSINADVEKRANHRAENEGENGEEKMVTGKRVIHTFSRSDFQRFSLHEPGDPDAT